MCEAWTDKRDKWVENSQITPDIRQAFIVQHYNISNPIEGARMMPINYCPWCGAKLPDDEHE